MAKKQYEDKISGLQENKIDPDLFGRSVSREEIKEQQKAEKKAKREAEREKNRQVRANYATVVKEHRTDLIVFGVILAVLIVGLVGVFIWQTHKTAEAEKYDQDPDRDYFILSSAEPEMKDDGLSAAINKVYYTRGGYLCVHLIIGNGTDVDQHMSSLDVVINNDKGECIASGYTEDISPNYTVPANDTNDYHFFISPEFVEIRDDPLSSIAYTIALGNEPIE